MIGLKEKLHSYCKKKSLRLRIGEPKLDISTNYMFYVIFNVYAGRYINVYSKLQISDVVGYLFIYCD